MFERVSAALTVLRTLFGKSNVPVVRLRNYYYYYYYYYYHHHYYYFILFYVIHVADILMFGLCCNE